MKLNILTILIFSLTIFSCSNQKSEKLEIPTHELFIPENIEWINFEFDIDYLKSVSKEEDSLIILTQEKIIIIKGQYGLLPNDKILIPWSGEFGINYRVIKNKKFELSADTLQFNRRKFLKSNIVNFQWWDEIIGCIDNTGSGTIIVSGP